MGIPAHGCFVSVGGKWEGNTKFCQCGKLMERGKLRLLVWKGNGKEMGRKKLSKIFKMLQNCQKVAKGKKKWAQMSKIYPQLPKKSWKLCHHIGLKRKK